MGKLIKKAVKASTFGAVDLDKKAPKPKPVRLMPDPEDPEIGLSKQREVARRRQQSGRASTILSGGNSSGSGFGG